MAEASRIKKAKLMEWVLSPTEGVVTWDRFIRVCRSHISAEQKISALELKLRNAQREAATLRQALSSIHGQADNALFGRPDMTAHIG